MILETSVGRARRFVWAGVRHHERQRRTFEQTYQRVRSATTLLLDEVMGEKANTHANFDASVSGQPGISG
jgi:hypothetical protein